LPDVFITYQRRANSAGYFAPDRFSSRTEKSAQHELALNPDGFIGRSDQQIVQTLCHEMTHVWQQACGAPAARGYHNREWADKMKSIGLQPSSTGMVGGKEVGQHMSDYIIPDGPFVRSYEQLAKTGWRLNLQSAPHSNPTKAPKLKTKFSCESCGQNAWGKPELKIICKPCGIQMRAAGQAGRYFARTKAGAGDTLMYEITQPVKRKRGRPKGSKNKPQAPAPVIASYEQAKRKRGRPKGSKSAP
jgi:SprT-like family